MDVGGVYQGETGILELKQDENYIEGKYQFDTGEFIGLLNGTLEGDIIKFSYYWIDGSQQGSGIFYVYLMVNFLRLLFPVFGIK